MPRPLAPAVTAPAVQTVADPRTYSRAQLQHAVLVSRWIDRGVLILCTPPRA